MLLNPSRGRSLLPEAAGAWLSRARAFAMEQLRERHCRWLSRWRADIALCDPRARNNAGLENRYSCPFDSRATFLCAVSPHRRRYERRGKKSHRGKKSRIPHSYICHTRAPSALFPLLVRRVTRNCATVPGCRDVDHFRRGVAGFVRCVASEER
jgi:hypothetical protein